MSVVVGPNAGGVFAAPGSVVSTTSKSSTAVQSPDADERVVKAGAPRGVPGETGPEGPPGPQGPIGKTGGRLDALAGENIPAFHVVRQAADGKFYLASSLDPDDVWAIVGVAEHNAVAGEVLTTVQNGELLVGSPFPLGPLFLDEDGSLTPDPNTGSVQLRVADAVSATTINVRLEPAIHH